MMKKLPDALEIRTADLSLLAWAFMEVQRLLHPQRALGARRAALLISIDRHLEQLAEWIAPATLEDLLECCHQDTASRFREELGCWIEEVSAQEPLVPLVTRLRDELEEAPATPQGLHLFEQVQALLDQRILGYAARGSQLFQTFGPIVRNLHLLRYHSVHLRVSSPTS